jgi:aminoglycoside phosphotransferase (APT) family kinase protein
MNEELAARIQGYLSTAPGSGFLGQEVTILDGWQGADNLLWRAKAVHPASQEDAVVKLFLDAGQARSRRQYDGHQTFAAMRLAPEPLWVDRYPEGLARQILVYRWVEGEPLSPTPSDLDALAETVAAVHSSDVTLLRRFCPHPINLDFFWRVQRGSIARIERELARRSLPNLSALFARLAEETEQLVARSLPFWQGAAPAPVHGDLRLENCLLARGAVVLLDWEMFGLGDAALDAATFLHHHEHEIAATSGAQYVQRWLDLYLNHCEQVGLEERIETYRQLLPFQAACFLILGLLEDEPEVEAVESPEGRQEYANFLSSTLAAALERATAALKGEYSSQIAAAVAELIPTI